MASRPLTDAYTGHDTFIPYLLNRSTSALNADFQTLLRSHDLTLLHWRVLSQHVKIPVIASGGVTNLKDIEELCAVEHEGIEGVILGRSIYEGTLDFAEAQTFADEYPA